MGEAVYSIIAEFPEPVSAAKAQAIKEFFLEGPGRGLLAGAP